MSLDPARAWALLEFWFGMPGTPECDRHRAVWFKPDPAFDAALRDGFYADHIAAVAGGCAGWEGACDTALALVLLLDQLPRNLNRGSADAFACDAEARAVASRAIANGFDHALPPVRRSFVYLPFEHSEDLADQERSLLLFASLPPGEYRDRALDSARRHHVIIARFGRFPHRNRALGRRSTLAEAAFLQEPGSSF